jgi:hypothetical protein
MQKMEYKMTFFGMTVNKLAREHHFQKMEVQLKDHWTDSLIKEKIERNMHIVKILDFHFMLVYFPLIYTFSVF